MDEMQTTIGMTRLFDEIDRDLDDFRKKHASDYSAKNVTLWWELERERLVVRHGEKALLRKPRFLRGGRTLLFFAGFGVAALLGLMQRLL
jgi:hypothetical protein